MKLSTELIEKGTSLIELGKKMEKIESMLTTIDSTLTIFEPKEDKRGVMGIVRAEKMKDVEKGSGVADTTVQEWQTA